MTEKESKILVLIPAYNEHEHLAGVVTRAKVYLPVLVVDDGSKRSEERRVGKEC
mgnify:CR=1 FL=1